MKTQFVAILLLLLVASSQATATRQQVLQGKLLFNQMKDTGDIGKNLYDTIQLELSAAGDAGEDQTIVSKVVELLKEVQAQIQSDKDEIQGKVDENNEACGLTVDQLQVDIDELEIKIEEAEDLIPLKEDELKIEEDEANVIFQEVAFYREQLVTLEERATEKRNLFEEAQEEHNSLIAALQQAKKIITGLQAPAFLQKETSFVQLKNHFSNTLDFITKSHNRALLNYLIQVSQVADQTQVENIVEIFDDLIAATQQTQQMEGTAEQRRIALYESDKAKLVQNISDGETKYASAQADIKTAESRLRQQQDTLNSLRASQDSKKIQKQDQQKVCADQVANLESKNATYAELLELLRQVLILLENSSISQVKMMMSDVEEEEAEGEGEQVVEGEYLTYSSDEGELHTKEDYLADLQPENTESVQEEEQQFILGGDESTYTPVFELSSEQILGGDESSLPPNQEQLIVGGDESTYSPVVELSVEV